MDNIKLVRKMNEEGQLELVSVIVFGQNSAFIPEKGLNKKLSKKEREFFTDAINPFSIEDVKAMMLKPDLINTSHNGTYKLVSDYLDNRSGLLGNFLTYEKVSKYDIHKTR